MREKFTRNELRLISDILLDWRTQMPANMAEDMKKLSEEELKKIVESARRKAYLLSLIKCPRCKCGTDKILTAGKKRFCETCKSRNKLNAYKKKEVRETIANCIFLKEQYPEVYSKVVRYIITLAKKEEKGEWQMFGPSLSRLRQATPEQIIASAQKEFPKYFQPVTNNQS